MGWESILAGALPPALALLLLSAGVEDIRHREIAHWKYLAVAGLAPFWWWAAGLDPWPDMALQFGIALALLGVFAAAFALGLMGGGDVKLIAGLALWLPWPRLADFLVWMSLIGGAITVAMLVERRWKRREEIEVPYGVAIAAAGLLVLGEPILNQFR